MTMTIETIFPTLYFIKHHFTIHSLDFRISTILKLENILKTTTVNVMCVLKTYNRFINRLNVIYTCIFIKFNKSLKR